MDPNAHTTSKRIEVCKSSRHSYEVVYLISRFEILQNQGEFHLPQIISRAIADFQPDLDHNNEKPDSKTFSVEQSQDATMNQVRIRITFMGEPGPTIEPSLSWDGWPLGEPEA